MFTLMHISDLHRSKSEPISNDELLSGLAADQERFHLESPAISQPNAIIVSGDVVQGLPMGSEDYPKGLQQQYDQAYELLTKMTDLFVEGDRSKVIIIPGNHDVDWNKAHSSMKSVPNENVLERLSSPDSKFRWSWKTFELFEIANPSTYAQRLAHYREFYARFYQGVPLAFSLDAERSWNLFELDEGKILVCAYDSCASNDCFSFIGEVSFEAIAQSHLEMARLSRASSLKIAVWHHDVQGGPRRTDYMDVDTVKLMIDKGMRLGLHGHQHKSEAVPHSIYTSDENTMVVISAGSLCAGSLDLPTGYRRQYNIIEISDSYDGARIHVREMKMQGVFAAGRLEALGGRSYADVKWSKPPIPVINTGPSGGEIVAQMERTEQLIKAGQYEEAIDTLETFKNTAYGRRQLTEVLFRAEKWKQLSQHLAEPQNNDELAKLLRATITLHEWSTAERALQAAKASTQFSEVTIRELETRLNAEKEASK